MNVRMRILLAAALLSSSAVFALDLRDGRMLLSLDERTARFSVQYLADAARNRYVALLSEQDARTTYPTLSWNEKTFKLGESAEFRFSVKKEEAGGAVIEYKSSFALVRQTFRFIRSQGSPDADGLSVEFSIENTSGDSATAALRFLLDTYQGERSRKFFEIDGKGIVNAETALAGTAVPGRLLTPGDSGAALQIQMSGVGITRPDRLVLANWKRINDSEWSFDSSPGRSFTLLPFSIDDAAAALYFGPSEIRSGGTFLVRTVLGNRSDAGYAASPLPASAAPSPEPALAVQPSPFVGARTDIAALRDILTRIDALLASGKEPDPRQLKELGDLLARIRGRTKEY